MKKSVLIIIFVIAGLGIIGSWMVGMYNAFITMQENVENSWSQVENQYQRRADLVPNLVNTVKGYASHEQETFTMVMEARAKATQTHIDPSKTSPEELAAYMATQGELSQALSRLMMIAESYPELKASENFQELAVQLEGTENRITYARDLFNRSAKDYNASIRRFPNNIVASMFGFERREYFQADEGAEKAVRVEM